MSNTNNTTYELQYNLHSEIIAEAEELLAKFLRIHYNNNDYKVVDRYQELEEEYITQIVLSILTRTKYQFNSNYSEEELNIYKEILQKELKFNFYRIRVKIRNAYAWYEKQREQSNIKIIGKGHLNTMDHIDIEEIPDHKDLIEHIAKTIVIRGYKG